jgi:hypothetical protein
LKKIKWYGDWQEITKLGKHKCRITQAVDNIIIIDNHGEKVIVWPGDYIKNVNGELKKESDNGLF